MPLPVLLLGKWILSAVLLVGLLAGGALGWEHWRGRVRLGRALAELAARGETLDVAPLVPPPVAAESNGLAAFLVAAQRLSEAAIVGPPVFASAAPARLVPVTRMDTWPDDRGSHSWSEVGEWMGQHESDLAELRAATARPFRRPDLDWSQGFKMQLKHLSAYKSAIVVFSLAAMYHARQGDLERALDDLRACRTLEADLAGEPLLITQLVRIAGASIAASRGWHVLHAGKWSAEQLAALQEVLGPSDLAAATVRSLEGERALALVQLRDGPTSELIEAETFAENPDLLFGGGPAAPNLRVPASLDDAFELAGELGAAAGRTLNARVLFPLWRFAWGDHAIVHHLHCLDAVLRVQRESVTNRSAAHLGSLDLAALLEPKSTFDRLHSRYARSAIPTLAYAARKAFRAETELALLQTGIALRRFQLRHQRLPETLSELVPDYLPALPVDRMDGKPLRYRCDGDADFTLWSVGDDFRDDRGDATRAKEGSAASHWWYGRDAVWPHPATGEQIDAWKAAEARRHANVARGGNAPSAVSAELARRYGLKLPTPPPPAPINAPPAP